MSVFDDFDLILDYAHMWNWAPDWYLAQSIYKKFPESYSILTPFAYSYLEEMIRTTTSDYELPLFDRDKQPVKVSVGMALIALAIKENQNNPDYVALLEQAKRHFKYTQISIDENGRNSTEGFILGFGPKSHLNNSSMISQYSQNIHDSDSVR